MPLRSKFSLGRYPTGKVEPLELRLASPLSSRKKASTIQGPHATLQSNQKMDRKPPTLFLDCEEANSK